jgi:hypothetical protein
MTATAALILTLHADKRFTSSPCRNVRAVCLGPGGVLEVSMISTLRIVLPRFIRDLLSLRCSFPLTQRPPLIPWSLLSTDSRHGSSYVTRSQLAAKGTHFYSGAKDYWALETYGLAYRHDWSWWQSPAELFRQGNRPYAVSYYVMKSPSII